MVVADYRGGCYLQQYRGAAGRGRRLGVGVGAYSNEIGASCNKMIIFIPFILLIGQAHLIISVSQSNSVVAANQLIAVKILTTSPIAPNALSLILPSDFAMAAQCRVDNATVACSTSTTTTSTTAIFSSSFASGLNYLLTINVTNPAYATTFLLNAAVSSSAFANSATFSITPKTIACSLSPASDTVGDLSVGSFSIGNDAVPAGSVIIISSAIQSSFANLFSSSPTCKSGNTTLTCTQSTSFSTQFLTISNSPTTANLVIAVASVNNPPYNGSFLDIALEIQTASSYKMQVCSFKQQAVTTLRTSTAFTVSSWNSSVGATSTVTMTLSTYFTPYTTTLLWVYDSTLSAVVLAPASSSLVQTNLTASNTISSTTAVGKSLSFSAQITNPPSKQPLTSYLYVIYSGSLFVEQYTVSNMVLTTLSLSVSLVINDARTSVITSYKITIGIPYLLTSPVITIDLAYGTFQCSNLSLASSTTLALVTCQTNRIVVTATTIPAGDLWLTVSVRNYLSVRSNSISATLTGPAPTYYSIGNGSTPVPIIINNQSIGISTSNSTFAASTTFDLLETYQGFSSSTVRTATIQLPIDIQLSSSTIVSAYNSSCTVSSFTISVVSSQISVSLAGPLLIRLSSIGNPVKYNGSLVWTIATSDSNGFSSSLSSLAANLYTPTIPSISASLASTTIEEETTLTLTIVPALQYYSAPKLTITLSNSLIMTPCSTCTALSSLSVSLPYTSAVMRIVLGIKNSQHPVNNSLSLSITSSGSSPLSYEMGTVSYALTPMAYTYIAKQDGLFGTIGSVNITILSGPTQPAALTYSDISSVLSGPVCVTCSNQLVYLTGIVQYFQIFYLRLNGMLNGIVYATSLVPIYYVCQSIQGCRICSNVTTNGTTSLACQQCFNSSLTNFSLLYQSKCLQACPISTYSNSLTCVNCPALCYICDMSHCQQCVPNYYLYNGSCISPCPTGYISNATSCITVPIICPQHCINCPADNKCSACDSGWVLLDNSCYSSCPTGYDLKGSTCVLFVPPEQAQYFPFAFLISACLLSISLAVIKCFEKRSLVMGNLIAFLSFVETGSMIMTLVYTFKESNDLLTQALCFVLLLSKVLMNLVFLLYFLRVIVPDEHFSTWRENDPSNEALYKVLITLSSIFSFQSIRILYSRLLGLRLFFGKFNTALIFKPLNYFTIGYFVTCALALVILSIRNIVAQNGYRTSTFYTSVESIIIELLLVITCIVDNKKGYDDEFFEYQIYKVNNQYESSRVEPIEIQQQGENAGSMHQILNPVNSRNDRRKNLSQIVKNPMWVKKLAREKSVKDQQIQSQFREGESQASLIEEADKVAAQKKSEIDQRNYLSAESKRAEDKLESNGKSTNQVNEEAEAKAKLQADHKVGEKLDERGGMIENKRENLFRKKIIEDWRQIEKTLPNRMNQLRWEMQNKDKKRSRKLGKSQSPDAKLAQSVKRELRRVSSVEKVEVRLPEFPGTISDRIKQYFHSFSPNAKQEVTQRRLNEQNILKEKQKQAAIIPKSMTLEAEIALSQIQSSSNGILQTEQRNPFEQQEQGRQNDGEYWEKLEADNDNNDIVGQEVDAETESADKRNMNKDNFIDEEDISNEDVNQNEEYEDNEADLQFRGHESNERFFNANHNVNGNHNNSHGRYQYEDHPNNTQLEAIAEADIELLQHKRKPPKLPGFRHEGQEKEKKYRTKKRKVNRQTEEVYLQRLVGSSQRKMRSRGRKLEF